MSIYDSKAMTRRGALQRVRELLLFVGFDTDREGVQETPERFLKYLEEFHQPINRGDVLGTPFPANKTTGMVVQTRIPFRMICEHHLLPAVGMASIGYIPQDCVIGLSKLTRLVQSVGTEAPTLQEFAGDRIAKLLSNHLDTLDVSVVIKAQHSCMTVRGINAPGVETITSSVHGKFRDRPEVRQEFFNLLR